MTDRYISKEWLLQTFAQYKNLKTWNESVCDLNTVARVLQVLENVVNNAPNIGPRQYSSKRQDARTAALKFQRDCLWKGLLCDEENRRRYETLGDDMLMGFYKGSISARKAVLDWLERMVRNG